MDAEELISYLHDNNVEFLDLFVPDYGGRLIGGILDKTKIDDAICGGGFGTDFSSVQALGEIEDSDGYMMPILDRTYLYPWSDEDPYNRIPEQRTFQSAFSLAQFYKQGKVLDRDPRNMAMQYFNRLEKERSIKFKFGIEAEFHLLKELTKNVDGTYNVVMADNCGYYNVAADPNMDFKKVLMRGARSVGVLPLKGHKEVGIGQQEIETTHAESIKAADDFNTLKFLAKRLALRYGMIATFAPKVKEGVAGNGAHIHMSMEVLENGKWKNAMYDSSQPYNISKMARQGEAGILALADDIIAITNPSVNDHKRMVLHQEATVYECTGLGNRSAFIRYPTLKVFNEKSARFENRFHASACNTYFALMAIAEAFMHGVDQKLSPVDFVDYNVYDSNEGIKHVPTLQEKRDILKSSPFVKKILGPAYERYVKSFEELHYEPYLRYCEAVGKKPDTTEVTPWEIDKYVMVL